MVDSIEWYFAKVGPEDAAFSQDYARQDYTVMAFALEQEEGQFASLELDIRNPRGPLLSGDIWLWFSMSVDGAPAVPLFFGRLVGIPRTMFAEKVTLQYDARPVDFGSQKTAVAEALKVLPYYDKVFIDEQQRDNIDGVLEGYSVVWHTDRVTHEVGVSDVLIGEDTLIELDPTDILYNGFDLDFNQIPLTSVEVEAVFNWDQIAAGGVDLTSHILENWPASIVGTAAGVITSYTLQASDWPKPGSRLADGWTAVEGTECVEVYDLTVRSKSDGFTLTIDWGTWTDLSGNTGAVTTTVNTSDQYLVATPPGSIQLPPITTDFEFQVKYTEPDPGDSGPTRIASINSSTKWTESVVPLHHLKPKLVVGFDAARPRKETVRFTMVADVQPVVTLPGEDETLPIKLNSVNLNEPLDDPEETDGDLLPPIRDPRRRSYAATERGDKSIKYGLAVARANLLKRSRAAQITERLTRDAALDLIPQISLTRNMDIPDPRIQGEGALGKTVAYRFAVDGSSGVIDCQVTIGCAIGRGGEVTAVAGTPTYATADTMGPDVQVFTGRTVLFDSSVGYSPAQFVPNDDNLDFLSTLTADDLIEDALTVVNPPATQRALLDDGIEHLTQSSSIGGDFEDRARDFIERRQELVEKIMEDNPTTAQFRLKGMKKLFESDQEIDVTQLRVPTQIQLEETA